jgi:hypothetical protein
MGAYRTTKIRSRFRHKLKSRKWQRKSHHNKTNRTNKTLTKGQVERTNKTLKTRATEVNNLTQIRRQKRSNELTVTQDRQEGQRITAVWQKWRFSASYDSFAGKKTVVLRINFSGENRHLRQAAKRYVQYIRNINKKYK